MSAIFLSYRRNDSAGYAGRLYEGLKRRLGDAAVFRDLDAIEPGQDFVSAIEGRLRECRVFLALIGRDWVNASDATGEHRLALADDFVRLEIAAALARPDVRLIPVFVEGAGMPRGDQLPEPLRGLTRIQGLSLRDDTWDSDVDRLVSAIEKTIGKVDTPAVASTVSAARRRPRWLLPGAAAIALVGLALAVLAYFDGQPIQTTAPLTTPEVKAAVTTPIEAHAIALPRNVESVRGFLIYTVLAASIAPHGDTSTLRLRIRASNEGSDGSTFSDGDFEVEVGGKRLSPTSGVNETVYGHSLKQEVISFEVPADARKVDFVAWPRLDAATIPLDLTPIADPVGTESRDTSDALSRAILVPLVRESRRLLSVRGSEYTLQSATARRFINATRLTIGVRLTNRSRETRELVSDAFTVASQGQTVPAYGRLNEYVDPASSATIDMTFELPPNASDATLHAESGGLSADVRFALPKP